MKMLKSLLAMLPAVTVLLSLAGIPAEVHAAAHEEEEAPATGLVYVALTPTFVTNYDGGGRLKYLKADVTLRVQAPADARVLEHLPYIRNRLVILLSSQLEENLTSTAGKEALRMRALEEVRSALALLGRPEAAAAVTDLYFTSYVVQR